MTNSDTAGPLVDEIATAICTTYGWSCGDPLVRSAIELPPETLSALAGQYVAETPLGPAPVLVAVEGGELFLEAPPFQPRERLHAASARELFLLSGQVIEVIAAEDGEVVRLDLPLAGLSAARVAD